MFAHRTKVVQLDDAGYQRRQCSWNLRIVHIGKMSLPADAELMDGGVERGRELRRRTRKIHHHAAGIDRTDAESVLFQPPADRGNGRKGDAEPLAKLLRGEPSMEAGRSGIVQCLDEGFDLVLPVGRAPQLQLEVFERHGRIDGTTVIRRRCLGPGVAAERHQVPLIDGLRSFLPPGHSADRQSAN